MSTISETTSNLITSLGITNLPSAPSQNQPIACFPSVRHADGRLRRINQNDLASATGKSVFYRVMVFDLDAPVDESGRAPIAATVVRNKPAVEEFDGSQSSYESLRDTALEISKELNAGQITLNAEDGWQAES